MNEQAWWYGILLKDDYNPVPLQGATKAAPRRLLEYEHMHNNSEWAPQMDEVPAKEVTKHFGTNFGLIGTCHDRDSYSCKQHWTCNLSAFGSEKFAWYDLSAFASQKCLQKNTSEETKIHFYLPAACLASSINLQAGGSQGVGTHPEHNPRVQRAHHIWQMRADGRHAAPAILCSEQLWPPSSCCCSCHTMLVQRAHLADAC